MGLLAKVEQRASIENPSTSLANPDAWLVDALGGGSAASGVTVNHQTALKLSAVWACTNVLSQDIAKLPLLTYRRLPRGKERARDHPLYRVLHDEANPQMSAYNFRRTLQAHVVNWGKAFAEIERNRMGEVIALWPLLPDRTEVHRIDGRKIVVTRVNGKDIPIAAENVLHIPGLGFDGLRGYSVIGHAKESIGSAMAAEQFGSKFFGNGARPGGVVTTPKVLSEEAQDRFRRSWNSVHQGLTNAQRIAILDEGMDYKQIGIPPEDAQFLQLRQYGVEDVIRFYRVPPHKVGHLLHAGVRANVENENQSYVNDSLQAWAVAWEQEINRTLFAQDEQAEFFAEHSFQGLLRGDSAARSQFYQSGINNGWMSPNEARGFENMNPVDGGDQHFVPLNLIPLDLAADMLGGMESDGDPDEPEPEPDANAVRRERVIKELRQSRSVTDRHRIQQAHRRGFARIAERVVGIEVRELRKLADKAFGQRDSRDFLADVDRFYRDFQTKVEQEFSPLIASYSDLIKRVVDEEVGSTTEPDPDYEAFTERYTEGMARRHVQKSQSQIEAVVRETPEEQQAEAINQRLDEWEDKRPGKIGMVESVRAMGALSKAAYIAAGILTLVWRTIGDSCPYCNQLNGLVVGIRETFVSRGDVIDPGGDVEPMRVRSNAGHPPIHGGCDCMVSAGF